MTAITNFIIRLKPTLASAVLVALLIFPSPAKSADPDVLQAVVGIKSEIPPEARTARFLGTERIGSGIVIDDNGLVLTIGYLILEAQGAIVTGPDGKQVPATVVAYDHDTGLGLLRLRKPLNVKPMKLGDSAKLSPGNTALVVSRGGPRPIIPTQIVSRRTFTGYWEYMLERAIFTSPPHSFHSGAALVGGDGKLLGVGSLFVGDAAAPGVAMPGNMFVPVNGLKPILAELLENGRRDGPARPWIGANTTEVHGRIVVIRISNGGPASIAGLKLGDMILGVDGHPVKNQIDFYRRLWSSGPAGDEIILNVLPKRSDGFEIQKLKILSKDRQTWLRVNR